jgi:hypothetical protein
MPFLPCFANAEQRDNAQHQADDHDKKRDALKGDFRPGWPRENAEDKTMTTLCQLPLAA